MAFLLLATPSLVLMVPGVGYAAVNVSRTEVSAGTVRIEGTAAPTRTITVDGVAMGTSDGGGRFKIQRSPHPPTAPST